ncbi:MAG: hypothetical protein AB4352_17395 [Hormoscilla sp.]
MQYQDIITIELGKRSGKPCIRGIMLESEIAQAEEDLLSEDPRVQAEIQSARLAYQKGDYQTIEEYIASRSGSKP